MSRKCCTPNFASLGRKAGGKYVCCPVLAASVVTGQVYRLQCGAGVMIAYAVQALYNGRRMHASDELRLLPSIAPNF